MPHPDGTERLVPLGGSGVVLLLQDERVVDLLAIGSNGILVKERPANRRNLRLRYSFAGGDIVRAIAVRLIEQRTTADGRAYFLRIASDARIARLAELANRERTSPADYVAAASELGANRRPRPGTRRAGIGKSVGGALLLTAAASIFFVSAYLRYGVATFSGSLTATSVELVRAEHPGVFYPYESSGSRLLKVGELIGVIDGTSGRSFGVPASCQCYLGDFPVNAGSTLYKGAVLARLIRPDSVAEVVASVPVGERWQIEVGDPVRLKVGSRPVNGHVMAVETDRTAALATDNDVRAETSLTLRIGANEPIDPALYGSEITVDVLRAEALAARAWAYFKAQAQGRLPIG